MRPILALALWAVPSWATYLTVGANDLSRGAYVEHLRNGERFNSFAGLIFGNLELFIPIDLLSADLYRTPGFGTYYYNSEIPSAPWQGRIAWLYSTQVAAVNTPELGAGLQFAIWDIMADGGDGLATGYLRSSSETPVGVVNAWLNFLAISAGQSAAGPNFYKTSSMLTGFEQGNLIGATLVPVLPPDDDVIPGEDIGEVPEAKSIIMIVVSIPLIGVFKRYL